MSIRYKISCWFIGLFLCWNGSLFAQNQFANSFRLSVENGLSWNNVRAIKQDEQGFMWLGTAQGLCRYNGTTIKTYQADPHNKHTLLSDFNMDVLTTKGKVWSASYSGLSVLNTNTDTFTNYIFNENGERLDSLNDKPLRMFSLYQDKKGEIWCGTVGFGFGRYIPEQDSFEFFQFDNEEVLSGLPKRAQHGLNVILSIHEHLQNDSIVWFGTNGGIIEFNRYTKTSNLISFPYPEIKNGELPVRLNSFHRLYQHADGLLYSTNFSNAIRVYDPSSRTLSTLPSIESFDPTDIVHNICKKSDHELWVTSVNQLKVYDLKLKKETQVFKNNFKELKIYGVNCIDSNNGFWAISTVGAFHYNPVFQNATNWSYAHLDEQRNDFTRSIYSIENTTELIALAHNESNFYHLDRESGEWSLIPIPKKYRKNFLYREARVMVKDPQNNYTVYNGTSFFTFDPINKRFKDFAFQPPKGHQYIRDICWDKQGQFWMSTWQDGLLRWNPRTGQVKNYFPERTKKQSEYQLTVASKLFVDSRNNIWIKRNKGSSIYLAAKDTIIQLNNPLNEESVSRVTDFFAEDKRGRVWMWGKNNELGYADVDHPEKGIVEKFDLQDIDPQITWVESVNADSNGDIWSFSNNNIIKINANDLKISLYTNDYFLNKNSSSASTILPNDELAIGFDGKFVILDLQNLQRNQELPKPYVANVLVFDKGKEFEIRPNQSKTLQLSPNENFFSLEFATIGYTLPKQIKSRYRLKNFIDEWLDAKANQTATFTNVPGGDYVFQLQACNNEGIWNEEIYELPIHVETPWYKTILFWVVVLASILALVYAYYRERIAQIRKESDLKTAFEKQKAGLEMSALRAQMNPHFIFNCLNSIDTYIIKNDSKKASTYLNNFGRLVRLILLNSRTNYVNLQDELEALDLYLKLEQMRLRNSFTYEIVVKENFNTENFEIPPMLIQPFVENSIWHGLQNLDGEGKIKVEIQKTGETLKCTIEDNGIGRAAALKINASKKIKRKSMGMSITNERIGIINKIYETKNEVKIEDLYDDNHQAQGTKVALIIPL